MITEEKQSNIQQGIEGGCLLVWCLLFVCPIIGVGYFMYWLFN